MRNKTKLYQELKNLRLKDGIVESVAFELINWQMIELLKKEGVVLGRDFAEFFNISPKEVRKHIQNIRENNHKFFNPTNKYFIVASKKGYCLTNNTKIKQKYLKRLKRAALSKKRQALELEFTL